MPIKCQFNLSRSAGVFYAGEEILGSLTIIVTKKPVQVEGLKITLLGLTTINWKETLNCPPQIEHNDSTRHSEPVQENYTATKIHIHHTQQLADAVTLLPGHNQLFNFQFQLPTNLPATCRLGYGSINYTLELMIERKGKHVKSFQQRLIVKKRLEFNDLRPQTKDYLKLARSVFVPGQSVAYELVNKKGYKHLIRLFQCVTYRSDIPQQKIKRVNTILDESCELQDELHLPLTAPIMTNVDNKSQEPIQISYHIETWDDDNQSLQLPLYVGTVAPPTVTSQLTHSPTENASLCFINLALNPTELLTPLNQLLAQSCSREMNVSGLGKHCERIKLLTQRGKKQSYVRLAMRYFYKTLLP